MEANAQVHHQILNRERLDYIDSAKGGGSLLVIVGHHLLMSDNLIELTILFLAIVFINRFAPYLLRPPVRRSTCTNTK